MARPCSVSGQVGVSILYVDTIAAVGGWSAMSTERQYADHRPYEAPPSSLGELVGPTSGFVTLPPQIDCGPPRPYDMASDDDRRIVYERVLREAS